ncbi:flagellar basal-body rod protein FlgC [Verrucomicrobiota bacterium]|nr:flagellar basal-body rod protein FlgC [Verrucomicrobiota bacterium]
MINLLTGIESTAAALNAERVRLEVTSQNIANANTTRGLDGQPYRRQTVVFETLLKQQQAALGGGGSPPQGVQVARIEKDKSPFRMTHIPGHPDANADGMVAMPNVNVHEEMVDLMAASRAFEANLSVVKNARSMAMQALQIGKR